jgi:hypothetical protein
MGLNLAREGCALAAVVASGPDKGPVGGSDSQPLFSTAHLGCGASFSGAVEPASGDPEGLGSNNTWNHDGQRECAGRALFFVSLTLITSVAILRRWNWGILLNISIGREFFAPWFWRSGTNG